MMKRIILEMGTGNDLYGEDYTKAACRAVDDALHHSSLTLFRSLGFDHADMDVRVTVAVQDPEKVDQAVVAAELPRGNATVQVVTGGLDVVDLRFTRTASPCSSSHFCNCSAITGTARRSINSTVCPEYCPADWNAFSAFLQLSQFFSP